MPANVSEKKRITPEKHVRRDVRAEKIGVPTAVMETDLSAARALEVPKSETFAVVNSLIRQLSGCS